MRHYDPKSSGYLEEAAQGIGRSTDESEKQCKHTNKLGRDIVYLRKTSCVPGRNKDQVFCIKDL
jgi:hypothetical protein